MSLPEHTGYKSHLKRMSNVAMQVGKALGPRKRPSKAVDTSQFSGVASGVRDYRPQEYTGSKKTIPVSRSSIGRLSVPYGGKTRYEAKHWAIDLAGPAGTPIPSTTGGKVSKIITGKRKGDPGFGNYIIVTDQQGNRHRYSHLSQDYVKVGQPVYRGMPIGASGDTGSTYAPSGGSSAHLDYRIRDIWNNYVNPIHFIQ